MQRKAHGGEDMGKRSLSILAAFFCLVWINWFMPELAGLTAPGRASLAVAVFAIIIWVTQALDDAFSGLLIIFLLAAMKAVTLAGAFSGYSNTALWLIVIGFIMAGCMEKSGLSRRVALLLVASAGGSTVRVYWAVALVMALLMLM